MEETTAKGQVSRRTIAKGMAWAAPAIPVVAMAPKASASVIDEDCVEVRPAQCKNPGSPNGFSYDVEICNVCATGTFTVVSIAKSNGSGLSESANPPAGTIWTPTSTITVGPGQCVTLPTLYSTNSANNLDVTLSSGGTEFTLLRESVPPC